MKDELGDRMKAQYEDRTRFFVPRRTYTIIRVDGKAFHTLTKGFKKPFDNNLMRIMDNTARALCEEIQGARFAYVQSDEISVLLTDFANIQTNAWFDGNVQKMCSIAAACATLAFNNLFIHQQHSAHAKAMFDARVFTIPDRIEVRNYFVWRQNDAVRNSIQMAARALYSHKELEGKSTSQLQELMHQKGVNWNDYESGEKRGRCVIKETYNVVSEHRGGPQSGQTVPPETITRHRWVSLSGDSKPAVPEGYEGPAPKATNETPIFTQDIDFLNKLIPKIGE